MADQALFATNIASIAFDHMPAGSLHKLKLHVLDTIGVSLAGSRSSETLRVREGLRLTHGSGDAAVWGTPDTLDPRSAAFVNGVSAHALELDDCGGCDHSGAVVLPAALAALAATPEPVSGRRFLVSILAGYEAGRRVLEAMGGYEAHNGLGWHSTGTCGVFGAAAAAATVFGLDARLMSSALGLACSYAGGTWAFIHDGSQSKKLHAGRAAEGGLSAALLARASFAGPAAVFSADKWGSFLKTFGGGAVDADRLTAGFGQAWRIDRCSIKPYATCRGTHSAIDAVNVILRSHRLDRADIALVEVGMSSFQAGMCGHSTIASRADAQMSLPYAIAAQLVHGRVGLPELDDSTRSSPAIADWLTRIVVRVDAGMADDAEPEVGIRTRNGGHLVATVAEPYGGPNNPMSDEAVIDKFNGLAEPLIGQVRCQEIVRFVLGLETVPSVAPLARLLGTAPPP